MNIQVKLLLILQFYRWTNRFTKQFSQITQVIQLGIPKSCIMQHDNRTYVFKCYIRFPYSNYLGCFYWIIIPVSTIFSCWNSFHRVNFLNHLVLVCLKVITITKYVLILRSFRIRFSILLKGISSVWGKMQP